MANYQKYVKLKNPTPDTVITPNILVEYLDVGKSFEWWH